MRHLTWLLVFWYCLVFSTHQGWAVEAEETKPPTELEQITVSAHRGPVAKDVIPREEVQAPRVSGSVLDVLGNEAGVQLTRSSLSGSGSGKMRLRGFDETRLRITKDGVPLNRDGSYGNGPVDWSILSGENVEQVEIYRGAGPAKFGNTLGGVVNIVTAKPTEEPETVVRTAYGSMDTWDSSIAHTWKVGNVGWALSAGHYESDGHLRNNSMDRDNFSALVTYDLPAGWQVGGGLDYSIKENGNPVYNRPDSPYYNSGEPDADEKELGGPWISPRLIDGAIAWGDGTTTKDENLNWTAHVEKKVDRGGFSMDYRLWNQDRTETYFDASDSNKKIYQRETAAEDGNWSLQAAGQYSIQGHNIEAGGETRQYGWGAQDVSHIDSSYFNGSIHFFQFIPNGFEGQKGLMAYHALYAQDTWTPRPDLTAEFGVRQEWFSADSIDPGAFGFTWPAEVTDMDESHLDPRLALTYRPVETAAISARFGMTHRYPTSPEYFWWYLNNGTRFFNTDFSSEAARQYELSYTQSIQRLVEIVVRGYYYDIDDYITSTMIPGTGQVVYNIENVEIKGLEMGFSADLPYRLRVWTNLTWQEADKSGDPWDEGNQLTGQLPDLPETMVNAGIDYTGEKFRARLWMNYVDDREHLTGNTLKVLDAYTLVNASAAYRIWDTQRARLDLEVAGENLLDEDYQEEPGYPMPGASVMAGIRLEI